MFAFHRNPSALWTRLIATPALLALLLGQTLAALHVASSEHAVCPDHGEAVEAPAACHAPSDAEEAGSASDPAEHDEQAHHTCAVLHAWSLGATTEVASEHSPPRIAPAPSPSPPALGSRPARIAPWRIAPKNSPPSA